MFAGDWLGAAMPQGQPYGEVVFNTGMTGYQEILTDPSYAGQIVVMTYPLMGNYGINGEDFEAEQPWLSGFVTGEVCPVPSHHRSGQSLDAYLQQQGIGGLTGVDTRALVRTIRAAGSLKGWLLNEAQMELYRSGQRELTWPAMPTDLVQRVTTDSVYARSLYGELHVVLLDCGMKANIADSLARLGCRVTVVPASTSVDAIRALRPDGVLLSNGPGDPTDCAALLPVIRQLGHEYPLFGICLGHQLLALAYGAQTEKLKFGHRGSNHPVREVQTGKVWITAQNHGYTVCEPLPTELRVTHRNVNDGTVEGLEHVSRPVFSVQFHPEAAPGPQEAHELFTRFLAAMTERRGGRLACAT